MKKVTKLIGIILGVFLIVGCDVEKENTDDQNQKELKIGQIQYSVNGTRAFANTTVVMQGDKIVKAYIDEYNYMSKEGSVCVPNSDSDFGSNVADQTKCLASKRVNNEIYSANMKSKGNATKTLLEGYTTIEKYAEGKTIAELETAIVGKETSEVLDTVAGATLEGTQGYIESIIEAAKIAK